MNIINLKRVDKPRRREGLDKVDEKMVNVGLFGGFLVLFGHFVYIFGGILPTPRHNNIKETKNITGKKLKNNNFFEEKNG